MFCSLHKNHVPAYVRSQRRLRLDAAIFGSGGFLNRVFSARKTVPLKELAFRKLSEPP